MTGSTQEQRLTYAEYLALEAESDVKHEFFDGFAVAMAGGSVAHARLVGNIYAELRAALRGMPCRPAGSEQRAFLAASGLTSYPDAAVFCPPLQRAAHDHDALCGPTAWFEVLSPSTERYDSAEKWSMLMREPSLQHYVLIDQHSVLVEHRWRGEDGVWRIEHRGPGQQLELGALGLSLSVDALYEDVLDVMVPRARLRPVAAVF